MLAKLYKDGTLMLDELVSQEIQLEEINEAFEVDGTARSPAPSSSTADGRDVALRYAHAFGNSDLVVSEVGFGTWTLVSDWWGALDDQQEMLHAALDAGINFFDTAPVYGDDGAGESILADVPEVEPRRDRPHHQVRLRHRRRAHVPGPVRAPAGLGARRRSASSSKARCAGSAPTTSTCTSCTTRASSRSLDDALWEVLVELRAEGKVRELGVALGPAIGWVEEGTRVDRRRADRVAADRVQHPRAGAGPHVRERDRACAAATIGLIARVPHASDTLSGKVTLDTVFPPDDHRVAPQPRQHARQLREGRHARVPLGRAPAARGARPRSPGILANPAFTTVLPTVRRVDDVREYAAAVDMPLTADEVARARRAVARNFDVDDRYVMPMKSSV